MTRLTMRPRAIQGLRAASPNDRQKIYAALDTLKRGYFPAHTKKLEGASNGYRTRVGRWRILFTLKNDEADIADIFFKKERGDYRRRA